MEWIGLVLVVLLAGMAAALFLWLGDRITVESIQDPSIQHYSSAPFLDRLPDWLSW